MLLSFKQKSEVVRFYPTNVLLFNKQVPFDWNRTTLFVILVSPISIISLRDLQRCGIVGSQLFTLNRFHEGLFVVLFLGQESQF